MGELVLRRISEVEWEIPKSGDMNVPVRIFASDELMEAMRRDRCLDQARNMATLPTVVDHVVALSDAHQGYGFPIGGVAAFPAECGIVSPGGVGYDINCGVRLLATNIPLDGFMEHRSEVLHELTRSIPSGVGRGGKALTKSDLREVLRKGSEWAVEAGMGCPEDLQHTEECGRIGDASPEAVSQKAFKRGMPQVGTLGAGNHFIEVQKVDKIIDSGIARVFGLSADKVTIMVHCGSRGLGHQIAGDYIRLMENKFGFADLADRQLINAPIRSELGEQYMNAMNCAVNFAFCNRQVITHRIREVLRRSFAGSEAHLVYDVCHNIAKLESHRVHGKPMKLCVHRKGATRSFGPGREEVPDAYREIGQPVIIPGSMGTASYVLVGTRQAEEQTFGSTAHGAGRLESRAAARRRFRGEQIRKQLEENGIEVRSSGWKGLVEEAPQVYKDIDEVVRVSDKAGVGKLVARMKPLAVMKG